MRSAIFQPSNMFDKLKAGQRAWKMEGKCDWGKTWYGGATRDHSESSLEKEGYVSQSCDIFLKSWSVSLEEYGHAKEILRQRKCWVLGSMPKKIFLYIFFLKISPKRPANAQHSAAHRGPILQAGSQLWEVKLVGIQVTVTTFIKSMLPLHSSNVMWCLLVGCARYVVYPSYINIHSTCLNYKITFTFFLENLRMQN